MRRSIVWTNFWARALLLAFMLSLLAPTPAHADVAPPEPPPGSGISPGSETTQVRMVSEQVILTIAANPASGHMGEAKTEATFLMHNLGTSAEQMNARFPLSYGEALYYSAMFPEINDIQISVDGNSVSTTRTTTKDETSGKDIPWANFPVNFPPGQDVNIKVSYTTLGFGYEPFVAFRYILETGAGWNGTIGSGDIVVNLPYPANNQNVLLDETTGYSLTFGTPTFDGNSARWHFDDFEPQPGNNFEVSLVMPSYWQKVLKERANITQNPNDGEAQGRLGKAIKEALRFPKGYLRSDDGGKQLYTEAVAAYDKSVTLLPKDPLWHYGYADLLWSHYEFAVYYAGLQDYTELTKLTSELKQSLDLDPTNQNAKDLAGWINSTLPWAVVPAGQGYDYLVLTATPTLNPETPTATPETAQPVDTTATPLPPPASPTPEPPATSTTAPAAPAPTKPPSSGIPFCGGSALLIPILAGLAWAFTRQR